MAARPSRRVRVWTAGAVDAAAAAAAAAAPLAPSKLNAAEKFLFADADAEEFGRFRESADGTSSGGLVKSNGARRPVGSLNVQRRRVKCGGKGPTTLVPDAVCNDPPQGGGKRTPTAKVHFDCGVDSSNFCCDDNNNTIGETLVAPNGNGARSEKRKVSWGAASVVTVESTVEPPRAESANPWSASGLGNPNDSRESLGSVSVSDERSKSRIALSAAGGASRRSGRLPSLKKLFGASQTSAAAAAVLEAGAVVEDDDCSSSGESGECDSDDRDNAVRRRRVAFAVPSLESCIEHVAQRTDTLGSTCSEETETGGSTTSRSTQQRKSNWMQRLGTRKQQGGQTAATTTTNGGYSSYDYNTVHEGHHDEERHNRESDGVVTFNHSTTMRKPQAQFGRRELLSQLPARAPTDPAERAAWEAKRRMLRQAELQGWNPGGNKSAEEDVERVVVAAGVKRMRERKRPDGWLADDGGSVSNYYKL